MKTIIEDNEIEHRCAWCGADKNFPSALRLYPCAKHDEKCSFNFCWTHRNRHKHATGLPVK